MGDKLFTVGKLFGSIKCASFNFFNIISDKPWLIIGDFNIVISFNEKLRGNWYSSLQCQIGQLWDSSSLIDLGFFSEKNLLI